MFSGVASVGRILLAILTLLTVIQVSGTLEKAVVAALLGGLFLARLLLKGTKFDAAGVLAMALLLPNVSWTGPRVLQLISLFFFLLRGPSQDLNLRVNAKNFMWITPFGAFLVGSLLAELSGLATGLGGTGGGFFASANIDGWGRFVDLVRSFLDTHVGSLKIATRVVLLALLVDLFSSGTANIKEFARWLVFGSAISASFVLAQWFTKWALGASIIALPNQTAFWDSLGRFSGLASDPNSLGVMLALCLWVVFINQSEKWSPSLLSWTALVFVAGIIAGSRTFFLALGILGISIIWRRVSFRKSTYILLICVSLLGLITALDGLFEVVDWVKGITWLPSGIKRGIAALSLIRFEETFLSRSIFIKFAYYISQGHWFFGIGANRFIDYVALAGVKLDLARGWRDNSNNFFIGLITELGIFGSVFFVLSIFGRRLRVNSQRPLNLMALVMLGVIGLTGPHTDFMEVLILVAAVVATASEQRPNLVRLYSPIAFGGFLLGLIAATQHELGVYGWSSTDIGAARWLSHRAIVEVRCEPTEKREELEAKFVFRPHYIPQSEPLVISYRDVSGMKSVVGSEAKEVRASVPEISSISIPCAPQESTKRIQITTNPAWSPYRAWPGLSKDRRVLGVEQLELTR
jgi:hypothetical protein